MRVVIFGGNGFIGTNVLRLMRNYSCDIVCVDSRESPVKYDNIEYISLNGEDADRYYNFLKKDDIVVILKWRGVPAKIIGTNKEIIDDNIVDTMVLIEACVRQKAGKIIFASSGGAIYGNADILPVSEDAVPNPISLYAVQKLMIEDYLRYIMQRSSTDIIILRISNPYGPGQQPFCGQGIIATFMACCLQGRVAEIWGDGNSLRDYIFIDDLSECIIKCIMMKIKSGTYNVGSGVGISIFDICRKIEKVTGKTLKYIIRNAEETQVRNIFLDCSKIKDSLGWECKTGLDEGLRITLDYLKNNRVENAE